MRMDRGPWFVAILVEYISQNPFLNKSKRLIKVMHLRNTKAIRWQMKLVNILPTSAMGQVAGILVAILVDIISDKTHIQTGVRD